MEGDVGPEQRALQGELNERMSQLLRVLPDKQREIVVLRVVVPLLFARACLLTYVAPDRIGMRQVAFGPSKGLQKDLVLPGYRHEISGYEQIRTFPRDLQAVEGDILTVLDRYASALKAV